MADRAERSELLSEEIEHLRDDLDQMARRGTLPPRLRALRAQLDALPAKPAEPAFAAPDTSPEAASAARA